MTDNEVWGILTSTFDQALIDSGLDQVNFMRAFQPRQEGAFTSDALYCHRISSKRFGWQARSDKYDDANDEFDHNEMITTESVYQVSSEVSENPEDENQITAFDVVSRVAIELNSYKVRKALIAQGIGIIRIIDVRTPFFKNESDRFEAEPSFDFTISYKQNNMSKVPAVTNYEGNISRV